MKTKNSPPSSEFESKDRCPSCGSFCNIHTDLDDNDNCNDCRIFEDNLETASIDYRDKSDDENTDEETMLINVNWYDKQEAFIAGAKWQQEQDKNKYSGEDVPNNLESVLAKITHQNDLGLSQWYEVVYYDNETEKWCCYSGSKTFQDGERVVGWKYCKDCL